MKVAPELWFVASTSLSSVAGVASISEHKMIVSEVRGKPPHLESKIKNQQTTKLGSHSFVARR